MTSRGAAAGSTGFAKGAAGTFASASSLDSISPVVCPPLRLLLLCAPNEGAAAVVLSATPRGTPAIRLAACQLRSHLPGSPLGEHTPLSGIADDNIPTPTQLAAQAAFDDAGREILSVEELGICPRFGGGGWVRDGGGQMASRLPINPSGGLLSKGEPLGASALGQIVELTWQLRGTAEGRQVPNARAALAHVVGRGANACVTILTR